MINAFTDKQRARLGFTAHDPDQTYDRTERLYVRICSTLDAGHVVDFDGYLQPLDREWLGNAIARAPIPPEMLTSSSMAVEGTDLETWGAWQGQVVVDGGDGTGAEGDHDGGHDGHAPTSKAPKGTAAVLGIGPDGRKIYTADPDARAGHRSATNSRSAGEYLGYELHNVVQTRQVTWTNYVDRVTLSGEVPGVITSMSLVPAGTHRGRAVADVLIAAKRLGMNIEDVVVDPGYSQMSASTMHDKLAAAGIHQTFGLKTTQRGVRPFSGDALLIDGQLFSSLLPEELRDLPMPPQGASEAEKLEREAAFNQRSRWRMCRLAGPDADGATRWRCPFHGGLLKSRRFPKTMRGSNRLPLVTVPEAVDRCCTGTFSAMPAELHLWQRVPYGTTARRVSMGRRQVVDSANAALKGGFVDMSRGFHRVFGLTKITVLVAFTVAGFNVDRVRSFRAKHRLADPEAPVTYLEPVVTRAKRRTGTWGDLVVDERAQAPPDPVSSAHQ